MLHGVVATGFQQIVEADDVALDVHIRVIDGITDACLGSLVHDDIEVEVSKQPVDEAPVSDAMVADVQILKMMLFVNKI